MNKKLISEWIMPGQIALVWPEHLPSEVGSKLKSYYKALIEDLVENELSVLLLYKDKDDNKYLKKLFDSKGVTLKLEPEICDIWIRDFGPLFLKDGIQTKPVKTRYEPSYSYSEKEVDWCEKNNKIGCYLTDKKVSKVELGDYHLILDGGNFIHNGFGTAIVTNRIISDNEHLFEHEIREILKKNLGIEELFIVPSEPGDDTGHIDGLVRFLNPNTLAVGQYPDKYNEDDSLIPEGNYYKSREVTNKIADYLAKNDFNVLRIPNSIPLKGVYKISCKCKGERMFENAKGNYLNFLRAENKIFVPQYNDKPNDSMATKAFEEGIEKYRLGITVIPVKSDATQLAEYGGVINCITLPLYDEKALNFDPFSAFLPVAKEMYENRCARVFLALKNEKYNSAKDYWNEDVIQLDLRSKTVFSPNNLQKISKFLCPEFVDDDFDGMPQIVSEILDFSPAEIRKMWKIFQTSENDE